MDNWHSLELELQKQAAFSGEIIEVTFVAESQALLVSRNKDMKLTYVPERNAVRWETEKEYGFERMSGAVAPLAATLIRLLYRR
jgi:UDP-N-acetyl-D-mannosaminuronate dehydrogenase